MSNTCKYCGSPLNDGDKFCQKCGAAAEYNPVASNTTVNNGGAAQANYSQNQSVSGGKMNGAAIAAFVCSLVGLILFALPMGIISICLAATSMRHISLFKGEKGKGLAIAGLVIGIIDVVAGIINIIAAASLF